MTKVMKLADKDVTTIMYITEGFTCLKWKYQRPEQNGTSGNENIVSKMKFSLGKINGQLDSVSTTEGQIVNISECSGNCRVEAQREKWEKWTEPQWLVGQLVKQSNLSLKFWWERAERIFEKIVAFLKSYI